MKRRSKKVREPNFDRFDVQRTLFGWAVIDRDGRPVANELSTLEAARLRTSLNFAAYAGRTSLAAELSGDPAF